MERKLLVTLQKTYGNNPIKPGQFGRRNATPSEIAQVIGVEAENFITLEPKFCPTPEDIEEKDDSFIKTPRKR